MALYTTLHLHNIAAGQEAQYAAWFDGQHLEELTKLRGFVASERFEIAEAQIMPDIAQPWRFLSLYEFDLHVPEIDLPGLGALIANARDKHLILDDDTERLYSYSMYSDWQGSPNWQQEHPLSGVSIILGTYVAGRGPEYHQWYDKVHSIEVTSVPGHVAMKRGQLSDVQIAPQHYCPGDQLILCANQTDDLLFTIKDFSARARGVSPSGIAMAPHSTAGSFARTVHYFKKISGAHFWPGGVAYAGDLSVYKNALPK